MGVLDNFDVLTAQRTFSIAEVRVLRNCISFNMSTASEIGYPEYVRVFVSKDKTQLALQPCDKLTPNAMKFFTHSDEGMKRRRTVSVGNKALATLVKANIGWDAKEILCAPGIRIGEENVIIFDLKQSRSQGESKEETGLSVIPQPAFPFYQLPAQYFSDETEAS